MEPGLLHPASSASLAGLGPFVIAESEGARFLSCVLSLFIEGGCHAASWVLVDHNFTPKTLNSEP